MRIQWLILPVLLVLCATLAQAAPPTTYYLALGDSLAIGLQPSLNGDVPTDRGYVDDLYAVLHAKDPALRLVKLGCSGETAKSMVEGGVCNYGAAASQLQAAEDFLSAHQVSLITLDIGANDVDTCIDPSTDMIKTPVCIPDGIANIATYLPEIVTVLHLASPGTPVIAMNYYDPFLAAWKLLPSPEGQELSCESLLATAGSTATPCPVAASPSLNGTLETVYEMLGVPVADVATAFHVSNFSDVPVLNLPVNVFLSLTLTWIADPLGPDIHPNGAGYATIAAAFLEKIPKP